MLSTDIKATDNVLWDPLTGAGLHLDHEEYEQFTKTYKDDHYIGMIDPDRFYPSLGSRMIRTRVSSPYHTCGVLFGYYFDLFEKDHIYDGDHSPIRSFFVIEKLPHPITVMRDTCAEGDSGPNPYPADFEYDTGLLTYYAPLRDDSILFIYFDGVSTRIIRLDEELRQHSSVGGHMFILDADRINAEFDASPRGNDSRFRYEVVLKKIDEIKAGGL